MSSSIYSDPFKPAPPAPNSGMAQIVELPQEITIPEIPTESAVPEAPAKKIRKKVKRLNFDSIFVLIFSVLIVFTLMATSFIASFNAIFVAAAYTDTPLEWRWVFPVFIDLAIFGYTVSLFVFKRRGSPVKRTLIGLIFFASISVFINFGHTFVFWENDLTSVQSWMGVVLAISAPVAVLLASEEIARLAFVDDDDDDDD